MESSVAEAGVEEVVASLAEDVTDLHAVDLNRLTARELLALAGALEVVSRRLDHAKDALAGHIDATGAHGIDGHKTAKAALVHINRVPGAEAHGSLQTARALRRLPNVDVAYAAGEIPTASVRAIARVASNPRVAGFVDDLVDRIFAAQACEASYEDLASFVRDWERFADADGADQDRDHTHRRRCFTGSSRDAALLQTAIRDRGGIRCFWADCNSPPQWMQVDHDQTWRALGPSDIANSQTACGHHNRLKETGYRPVRGPDGTYTYLRPDGTQITPPV